MKRPTATTERPRQGDERSPDVRLDRIQQPYGPCPAALDAADSAHDAPHAAMAEELRRKIGRTYRISSDSVSLFAGTNNVFARIVEKTDAPLVAFPPSTLAASMARSAFGREVHALSRGAGRDGGVPLDRAMDLPPRGIAMLDSPSDPLGSLLSSGDAVRLARACQFVIVDERYAELAGFSLLHLSAEFDNVVIVRSFEYWAGIDDPPCSWVAASPRTAAVLGLDGDLPRREALAGAMGTLASLDSVNATLRLLREERSRLYRFARKLSFLEPLPSWGPFLSARVDLVQRERVMSGLVCRGVHVHAPEEAGLERVVRIGIGSRSAMDRLRAALLELGAELLA